MSRPALEVLNVSKRYPDGTEALVEADLRVAQGTTVALVGESGSGKSTLLRLFNRMTEPSGGRVLVNGVDVAKADPVELRRSLGYVQQDGGLIPHWTVERNIELVPRLLGWPKDRRRRRCAELLAMVGLDRGPDESDGGDESRREGRANDEGRRLSQRYPAQLSGGQRQRVAIARALAADPSIVLLDEPFGALDALTRLEIQARFAELAEALDKTMLFVTHDLSEAFRLADRIAVLRYGRVLQEGTAEELVEAPAHPYVEALLAPLGAVSPFGKQRR